jgi:hypothetical protein
MTEPGVMDIVTTGPGPQVAVGARVNVPTNEAGTGLDVVPDPDGKFIVVACEPDLIRVKRVEAPEG